MEEAKLSCQSLPPILQADLMPLALAAASWGCTTPASALELPWLDAPPLSRLQDAFDIIENLGIMRKQSGGECMYACVCAASGPRVCVLW